MRYYAPDIDRILYYVVVYYVARGTTSSSNNRAFIWIELLVVIVILSYGSGGFLFPMISRANSMNHNNFDVRRDRLQIGLFGIDGVVFGIRLLLSLCGRLFKRMLFDSVVSMERACFLRMDIGVWRHLWFQGQGRCSVRGQRGQGGRQT